MKKNNLFEIRQLIIKARKEGWIEEDSCSKINNILLMMQENTSDEILKRFQEEELLTEKQVKLLKYEIDVSKSDMPLKRSLFVLRNVLKSYSTPEGVFYALKGITMTVNEGEVLGILGFSGSGKSTLLNIFGLLSTADDGSYINYNGTKYHELKGKYRDEIRKRDFGFIFQESHLLNHLNSLENVALPLRLQKFSNKDCIEKARYTLKRFMTSNELENVEAFFRRKPRELSGGQKQRVAAARAMVHSPKVIFADEPTGSLDFDTGQMVMDALFEVAREKKVTVVLVTHNYSQARQYCERFIWLEGGELKKKLSESPENTMMLVRQLSGKQMKGQ